MVKSRFLALIAPLFIYADDLSSLIEHAKNNNNLIRSSKITQESKKYELESQKSKYFPTLELGGAYQNLNERSIMTAGTTYKAEAKVGVDIYDGGRKSSLVEQKKDELTASSYDTQELQNSLALEITNKFFTIKSFESTLVARQEAQSSLKAQLERIEAFLNANLATSDDVDRLQAAYDTNMYNMEALKLQIFSLKKSLELLADKEIPSLEESNFKEVIDESFEEKDDIKALKSSKDATVNYASSLVSIYLPKLRVEDSYSFYGYGEYDDTHLKNVDRQNALLVTLNMRLFDNGSVEKAKESVLKSSSALNEKITFKTKEQRMNYEVAKASIHTSKMKIQSALSALKASTSAYKTIEEKYKAGIVDNVVYLDALSSKAESSSLYESSLNDLQIALASYYYYCGKNIEEFIQ